MTHFLLIYDLAAGRLLSIDPYPDADRAAALERRFALEREHAGDPNLEIIVLSASSLDGLRQTHARYFKSVQEIASGS